VRLDDLSREAVFVRAREMSWDPELYDARWGWDAYSPEGEEDEDFEGPLMSYFYPLPGFDPDDPQEAAKKLKGLPLCLVALIDCDGEPREWGMALTGGGMDLSWQICHAYIRMGYLPPLAFCNLPQFAGMSLTKETQMILAACHASIAHAERCIAFLKHRLEEVEKWLRRKSENARS